MDCRIKSGNDVSGFGNPLDAPDFIQARKVLDWQRMEWIDDGIVLGVRRHGETSAIAELLTRDHGRHLGLVRGGRSRRVRPTP